MLPKTVFIEVLKGCFSDSSKTLSFVLEEAVTCQIPRTFFSKAVLYNLLSLHRFIVEAYLKVAVNSRDPQPVWINDLEIKIGAFGLHPLHTCSTLLLVTLYCAMHHCPCYLLRIVISVV